MSDRRPVVDLEKELKRLPRHGAGPQFTLQVLGALDSRPRPRTLPLPTLAWSTAVALLVAALVSSSLRQASFDTHSKTPGADAESLKEEYRLLQNELSELHRQIEAVPVVYLGGDEDLELVLDLGSTATTSRPVTFDPIPEGGALRPRPAIIQK